MSSPAEQRPAAILCLALGGLALAAAIAAHPVVGAYYREDAVNYDDVMRRASGTALVVGAALLALGYLVGYQGWRRGGGAALLACSVAVVALADSMVLAALGLPYWVVDPALRYRHRPDAVRTWSGGLNMANDLRFKGKMMRLNGFGHHDREFAAAKPAGQLRGLFIGDSITMGQGVERDETFSARLEQMLDEYGAGQPAYRDYEMINTGVQGYTTTQERLMLEEALAFAPDFVAIGFCMNDVTAPFVAGGDTTAAPHGLIASLAGSAGSNFFFRFLQNETGFGRLVQKWRGRQARRGGSAWDIDIRDMASTPPDDFRYRASWRVVFDDLAAMYGAARARGLGVVLLIFPDTFQLFNEGAQLPQAALARHARGLGVPVIDFTPIFEEEIRAYVALRQLAADPAAVGDLAAIVQNLYFLDYQHLTVHGHQVVAAALAEFLHQQGIVALQADRLQRAREGWRAAASDYHIIVPTRSYELARLVRGLRGLGELSEVDRVCRDARFLLRGRPDGLAELAEACGDRAAGGRH